MKIGLYLLIGLVFSLAAGLSIIESGFGFAASTSSNTLTANVNVGNVVYVSIAPSSNTYASNEVYPGSSYDTNVLFTDTDNGGNLAANVFVAGNGFSYLSNSIGVSNTMWSSATQGTFAGTTLTGSLADTGIVVPQPTLASPSQSNSIYFGISIPGGTPPGYYTQTLTFSNNNLVYGVNSLNTATASLTANVQGVCYISLSSTQLNFGSIFAAANVPTNNAITDTDSNGNAAASVLVEGTNWYLNGNVLAANFLVGNTLWNPTALGAYSGNTLTNSLVTTGITIVAPTQTSNSQNAPIYFGLAVPGGTPAGAYGQTITIENSC